MIWIRLKQNIHRHQQHFHILDGSFFMYFFLNINFDFSLGFFKSKNDRIAMRYDGIQKSNKVKREPHRDKKKEQMMERRGGGVRFQVKAWTVCLHVV